MAESMIIFANMPMKSYKEQRAFYDNMFINLSQNSVNRDTICESIDDLSCRIVEYNDIMKNENLEYNERKKFSTSLIYAKRALLKIEKLLIKVGSGLNDDSDNENVNNNDSESENISARVRWQEVSSLFDSNMRTCAVINLQHVDVQAFCNDVKTLLIAKLNLAMESTNSYKVDCALSCKFKISKQDNETIDTKYLHTGNMIILPSTDMEELFTAKFNELNARKDDIEMQGSGWTLHEINNMEIQINVYKPLKGGNSFVELPKWLKVKHAIINVKNDDEYCFLWSILAAMYNFKDHPERMSKYKPPNNGKDPFKNILLYQQFDFPMSLQDIKKFEKVNDLSISVYGIEYNKNENNKIIEKNGKKQKIIVPYHLSEYTPIEPTKNLNFNKVYVKKTIHLLMQQKNDEIEEEEEEEEKEEDDNDDEYIPDEYHYTWIHNMSMLLSSQLSKHKSKKFFCDRCLCSFQVESSYLNHKLACFNVNKSRIELPIKQNNILKFKNYKYQLRVPFVVYMDIECLLKKVEENEDNVQRKSVDVQSHIPFSIGYYLKCDYDDSLSKHKIYRANDCIEWFINELYEISKNVDAILSVNNPMIISPQEQAEFDRAQFCYICNKKFTEKDPKVKDHHHFLNRYRGPAHNSCNINYQESCIINVVSHNMSGYDSHFILKQLATQFPGRMTLLPVNKEKYISFTKYVEGTRVQLRFIDSFRFMPSSIEKLASYLTNDEKYITQKYYTDKNKFSLVNKKGIFPYDFVDCFEKLNLPTLPTKDQFFSKLYDEHISDADYAHACNVWHTFDIKTLGEYSDLYLRTDILLLSDIFENFRDNCMETYKLDPLHFITCPSLAMQAMLKITEIELELLTDVDKMLFIESGIRGGLAQCSNRWGKANNKYMKSDYDPNLEDNYLMYFDVNNLYGASMMSYLPYKDFSWVENFNLNILNEISETSEWGYILEVDMDYPIELHDEHKDLPLAPIHDKPPLPTSKCKKLLTTLSPKKKYIIHYRNLQLYTSLGLKITNLYRVLKFRQKDWLKKYIDLNTELRKKATNEFSKNFYKFLNNSVFGKLMKDARKHRDVRIVTKLKGRYGAEALIAKPNFSASYIIGDLAIIEMRRLKIISNKPIYLGFSILDISKTYMYDFYYNYLRKNFSNFVTLYYMDTDSFILGVRRYNIYEYMKRDWEKFDTSEYSPANPWGIGQHNKKVVGLMKDETNGDILLEFIGLRAKMYAYRVQRDKKSYGSRAKGVKGSALRTITFDDYKNCLLNNVNIDRIQRTIQSKKHEVKTIEMRKLALSAGDDKRQLIEGSTDTLPWGYKEVFVDEPMEIE